MGNSEMVVGFGVGNVLLTLGLVLVWFWWRRSLERKNEINKGFFKLVLWTHGRLSLHQLEDAYTKGYAAGITEDDRIIQLALVKGGRVKGPWYSFSTTEEYTIEEIERENEHAGKYQPGQYANNARALGRYRDSRERESSAQSTRSEIAELEARSVALRKILQDQEVVY